MSLFNCFYHRNARGASQFQPTFDILKSFFFQLLLFPKRTREYKEAWGVLSLPNSTQSYVCLSLLACLPFESNIKHNFRVLSFLHFKYVYTYITSVMYEPTWSSIGREARGSANELGSLYEQRLKKRKCEGSSPNLFRPISFLGSIC